MFKITLGTIEAPPLLWLDGSDDSTLTSTTGVTEWRDKSGNNYHFQQSVEANRPTINTRTINSVKAVDWNGNKFMTLPAFSGPQILIDSMFFAVFDNDALGAVRLLLSFQQEFDLKFGFGVDSSGFFFNHSDNVINNKISIASATGVGLIAGYRTGTTQYIVDDAAVTANNALGSDQRSLDNWALGGVTNAGGSGSYFDGAIGEIKVYDYYSTTKFAEEIAALKTKWGIT